MITITNVRPFCIYFPALPRSFNIWELLFFLCPSFFSFSTYNPDSTPHIQKQVRVLFNNTHDTTFLIPFFLLSPYSFQPSTFMSRATLRLTSPVPQISFLLSFYPPPLPGLRTLLRASGIEEGAKLFGMWVGWGTL
jgi:hypothetical protein